MPAASKTEIALFNELLFLLFLTQDQDSQRLIERELNKLSWRCCTHRYFDGTPALRHFGDYRECRICKFDMSF